MVHDLVTQLQLLGREPFWLQALVVLGVPSGVAFVSYLAWNIWEALREANWLAHEREDPPQLTRAIEQASDDTPRLASFSRPAAKGFRRDRPAVFDVAVPERRASLKAMNQRRQA